MKLCNTLLFGAIVTGLSMTASATQFVGAGTGAIPDGAGATTCGSNGTPLVVSFPVAGLTSAVSTVGVRLAITHTWVGDVTVTLAAPGGAPSLVLFGRTLAGTATACGSGSDISGTYNFGDGATGAWWTAAAATPIPVGDYRTSTIGAAAGGGVTTSLVATFGGLPIAAANGTWTITVFDGGVGDTGTVDSAILFIDEAVPVSLQNFSVD